MSKDVPRSKGNSTLSPAPASLLPATLSPRPSPPPSSSLPRSLNHACSTTGPLGDAALGVASPSASRGSAACSHGHLGSAGLHFGRRRVLALQQLVREQPAAAEGEGQQRRDDGGGARRVARLAPEEGAALRRQGQAGEAREERGAVAW